MFVLGITGNSGSGKSTVCKMLAQRNAYVIDADQLARKVLLPDGRAFGETVDYFGTEILNPDGAMDRKALADIVFKDPVKLKALNAITHKHIIAHIHEEINHAEKSRRYRLICLDAPLLFESGVQDICNEVWVVDAPYEEKIRRIMERDSISREKADERLFRQTNPEELKNMGCRVIYNDGHLEALQQQVEEAFCQLRLS